MSFLRKIGAFVLATIFIAAAFVQPAAANDFLSQKRCAPSRAASLTKTACHLGDKSEGKRDDVKLREPLPLKSADADAARPLEFRPPSSHRQFFGCFDTSYQGQKLQVLSSRAHPPGAPVVHC